MIEQAFISVEYLADRDALHDVMDVPDGKLVRVDDCGEHNTKYFRWNRAKGEWVEEKFGSTAGQIEALEALDECGIITPAYQDGTFYTDADGTIYIL